MLPAFPGGELGRSATRPRRESPGKGIRDSHGGPNSLAGFGSAKCSNEEAYLFQKLIRAGIGTNNVDHCTRLCHASSVTALLEGIGSGAVTTTYADIANSDGPDRGLQYDRQPSGRRHLLQGGERSAVPSSSWWTLVGPTSPITPKHYCRTKPGTDVAFYNAMMHVIIEEDLVDRAYVEQHTENYEALREMVEKYSPEQVAKVCGIPAENDSRGRDHIRKGALRDHGLLGNGNLPAHARYQTTRAALIALALLTGNIGKPGTGLHPLRGQNNVQGASDAGLIPMVYPDYQSVEPTRRFARNSNGPGGSRSRPRTGSPSWRSRRVRSRARSSGMYIMGENPFLSDPNANKVRKALANLEFLVVQDIFLTETAEFADVILPASAFFEKEGTFTNTDRRVQIGRPALEAAGAGASRLGDHL